MSHKNIKVNINSLGEVEIKYVSGGDVESYMLLLDDNLESKLFAQNIIHHQLIFPEIKFEHFAKDVTDKDLLILIKLFIKTEDSLFEDFDFDGDVIINFANTLKKYLQDRRDKLEKIFQPYKESAESSLVQLQDTLKRISENFPSIPISDTWNISSEPITIVSPEKYVWQRHVEIMDTLNKSFLVQELILNEQKDSGKGARAALFATRITLAVAVTSVVVALFL